MSYYADDQSSFLSHHGILGQKWGVRRYQNKDGSLTSAGKKHYNTDYNKYELKAERRKEKSQAAAKAHVKALESGDEKLARKTEKKALKELNKYLNAEEKAGNYNAFDSYNSSKKHWQTESKIRRLYNKNSDGRYDHKLQELTDKSYGYQKDAESKQWKAIGRRANAEQIANNAAASGYTVRKIRTSRSFQTGKQRMALLLGVFARTTVPATYYKVRR